MTDNCDIYSGMLITVITRFTQLCDNIKRVQLGANVTHFHMMCEEKAGNIIKALQARMSSTVQPVLIIKLQTHLFSCRIPDFFSPSRLISSFHIKSVA